MSSSSEFSAATILSGFMLAKRKAHSWTREERIGLCLLETFFVSPGRSQLYTFKQYHKCLVKYFGRKSASTFRRLSDGAVHTNYHQMKRDRHPTFLLVVDKSLEELLPGISELQGVITRYGIDLRQRDIEQVSRRRTGASQRAQETPITCDYDEATTTLPLTENNSRNRSTVSDEYVRLSLPGTPCPSQRVYSSPSTPSTSSTGYHTDDTYKIVIREAKGVAFRFWDSASHGLNSHDGFIAGAFVNEASLHEPLSRHSEVFIQAAKLHLTRQEVPSPFISVWESLVPALNRALRSNKSAYISVVNLRAATLRQPHAYGSIYPAPAVLSQLKRLDEVPINFYHGTGEWLFWGQIPKGAIITTFSVKSLRKYLAKRSRLGELLRLNGIQESTSYSEYNRVITRDPPPLSAMIGRDIGHFLGFTNLDEGLLNIVASKIAKSWHFQGTVSVQRMEPYLTAVHDGYLTFFQQFRNGDFHDIITHFPPNPNHSSQLAHQPSFSSYPSSVSKDLASASAKPKPSIADDGLMMEFLEMGLAMEPISEYLSPVEMMVGIDERKRTECVSTKMPERMLDRIRVEARDLVGFADSDIDGDNNDTSLATGGAAIQQDIEFPDKRDNNRTKDILQRIETPSLVTWSAPTTPRSQGSSSEGNNEIPTPSTSTTTDEPVRSRYFGLKQHAKPPKERMFSALSILGSAMLRKNAPRLPMERQNIEDDDVIFLHETSRAIGGRLHDPQEAPKITRGNFSKSPVRNTKRTHPLNADMLNSDDELQYDDARANGFSTNRRRIQTLLNLDGIKKIA